MKYLERVVLSIFFVSFVSCSSNYKDDEIRRLLKSNNTEDLIIGAFKAGESGKTEFIPLLLLNDNNPGICTNIQFKGFSVYQEKMVALKKILKVDPPVKITHDPDSVVIRFYSALAEKYSK
jgi:hypothetical protein